MIKKVFVLLLCTLIPLISCQNPSTSDKPRILVSPKGLVLSFWLSVKAGAEKAGKEMNAEIIWKGPSLETDIAGQIDIIQDNINKRVDAIVVAACDATALVPILEQADRAGIPVITIDSGINSAVPKSFIATDNVMAAEKAADVLARLVHEKGEVGMIPFVPGAATSIMREQGFKKGLAKYPDMELVSVQYSQTKVEQAMAVTEDMVTAHPNLAGIFAANEAGTVGCAQALKSRGLAGKVKLVGFDASENELQALKDGTVDALIVQNPHKMGYLGVKTAMQVLNGEPVQERIDTGIMVITRKNLETPEIQALLNPPE
ncbi:substrate-binding domain-containing protein [candidate division KSB1 bacterium]|nr:substrate-binding domain-containing protein [candidate division KSB1 bacterium]